MFDLAKINLCSLSLCECYLCDTSGARCKIRVLYIHLLGEISTNYMNKYILLQWKNRIEHNFYFQFWNTSFKTPIKHPRDGLLVFCLWKSRCPVCKILVITQQKTTCSSWSLAFRAFASVLIQINKFCGPINHQRNCHMLKTHISTAYQILMKLSPID